MVKRWISHRGIKPAQWLVFLAAALAAGVVFANPTGGSVEAGTATIQQSPGVTQINQTSQQAIINWQSFNIGANEATHFQQPAGGVALNRINPQQGASQIYGQLTATGNIILVNQAGIYFGPTARVDVAGLIASTSDISNANFLAGKYIFDQPSAFGGSVINQGIIRAQQYGLVALVGTGVRNDGTIQANLGSVVLASGNKFTVDMTGDQLINFTVDEAATQAGIDQNGNVLKDGVNNSGSVIANGGTILMTAKAAQGVLDNVINMTGVAQATSVGTQNGVIVLQGDDEGTVTVAGTLDVSGKTTGSSGGTAKILGQHIHLAAPAVIDASGDIGGGTIDIGGDFHGAGPDQNAADTLVDSGVIINANAITNGNGGNVAVWSNNDTRFYGSINAQGGALGGNGGFIETSGHYLDVNGASINTLAPHGSTGTWLLDPINVDICDSGSSPSCTADSNATLTGSTYQPTDTSSTPSLIWVSNLVTALNSSNILVTTTPASGTGTDAGDINVLAAINSGSAHTLTLNAANNINVNADITVGGLTLAAGNTIQFSGVRTITTTASGSAGDLNFNSFFTADNNLILSAAGNINTIGTTGSGVAGTWGATAGTVTNTGNIQISADTKAGSLDLTAGSSGVIEIVPTAATLAITTTTGDQVYQSPVSIPGTSSYTVTFSSARDLTFSSTLSATNGAGLPTTVDLNAGTVTTTGAIRLDDNVTVKNADNTFGTLNVTPGSSGQVVFTPSSPITVTTGAGGNQIYNGSVNGGLGTDNFVIGNGGFIDFANSVTGQTLNVSGSGGSYEFDGAITSLPTITVTDSANTGSLTMVTPSTTQTWTIKNSGSAAATGSSVAGDQIGGTFAFSGMNSLTGGVNNDTFSFTADSTGTAPFIDGNNGGGAKIIDLSHLLTAGNPAAVSLALTAAGSTIGFQGSFTSNVSTSGSPGFDDITEVIGTGGAASNFTGFANTSGTWSIPASGPLTYTTTHGTFDFSGFNIVGSANSSGTDTFNIANTTLAGITITGGAGTNTFAFAGGPTYTGTITPAGTSNIFSFSGANMIDTYRIFTTSTAPIIISSTNTLEIQQSITTQGSVTMSADGTIRIDSGAPINTNGALNLSTANGFNGDIDINSAINTSGGNVGITFGTGATSGNLNINADVDPGTGSLTASVSQGSVAINAALTGGVNESFSITNAGDIHVNNTINTNGTLSLGANFGGVFINTPTITAGGTVGINGASTTGTVLQQDLTLTGNGVSFGVLGGAFNLTIKNNGTTTFGSGVGSTTPLSSLTIEGVTTLTGAGEIDLPAGQIITSGNQTYYGDVITQVPRAGRLGGSPGAASLSGANITFANDPSLNANHVSLDTTLALGNTLTISATGTVSFAGSVGSTATTGFNSISITAGSGIILNTSNMANFTLESSGSAGQTYTGPSSALVPITLNGNVTFDSRGTGPVLLNGTLDGAFSATVANNSSGALTVNGNIGSTTPLASLEFSPVTTVADGVSIKTSGNQTYDSSVTYGQNDTVTLTSSSSTLTYNGAVSFGQQDSVNSAGGQNYNSTVNFGPGVSVTSSGSQNYNAPVTLVSSPMTVTLTVNGTTGQVFEFQSTIDGASNLVLTGAANSVIIPYTDIGDTIPLTSLTVNGDPTAQFSPGSGTGFAITTSGAQTYSIPVYLDGATGAVTTDAFKSTSGSIQFSSTIDDASNLNVTAAGDITFAGNIGVSYQPLASITTFTTGSGVVSISPGVTIITANQGVGGSGNQTYNQPIALQSGTAVTMTAQQSGSFGGNIQFNNTVDGAGGLSLSAPGGDIIIDGAVGSTTPLASLSTSGAAGITEIAATVTANTQNYNNNVVLMNPVTTLATGAAGGSININSGMTENTTGSLVLGSTSDGNTSFSISGLLSPTAPTSITVIGGTGTANNSLALNPGSPLTWNVTGASSGNVSGLGTPLTFSTIQNLVGGSENDTFAIGSGASLTSIDGGIFGTKTLTYASQSGVLGVTLTGLGTNLGFKGTTTLGVNSFNDISVLTGSTSGSNTLTGAGLSNAWNVTGTNSGTYSASSLTMPFSNFQNLKGGSGTSDSFILGAGAVLNGTITGGSGANTYSFPTGGTFTGSIQGAGTSNDYIFGDNSVLAGTITGIFNDTLDFSAYSSPVNVILTAQGAGSTKNAGSTIASFSGITTLDGATNSGSQLLSNTITLPNKTNSLTLASSGNVTIGDPLVVAGFNSYTGTGGTDTLTLPLPSNATIVSNQAPSTIVIKINVNGVDELLSFFGANFGAAPPTPVPTPIPNVIAAANNVIVSAIATNTPSGGSSDVSDPYAYYAATAPGFVVATNINQIVQDLDKTTPTTQYSYCTAVQ